MADQIGNGPLGIQRRFTDMGDGTYAEVVAALPGRLTSAASGAVTVAGAGTTALLTISTAGLERIFVQFDVTTQALDAFQIQGRASPTAAFSTLYSTAADFTAPVGLLVGASGDLTIVAAAASGWFVMDVRGLYEVKLLASAAADSASVSVFMGGQ